MVKLTINPITAQDGPINLESWLQSLAGKYQLENTALLRQAALLAQLAGENHATPNGESCLHQGLTMTEILAELNLDEESLAAAMIYSSVCYAGLNLEDVAEHLGNKIASLIKGTRQMDAINILQGENYHSHNPATIDNVRKMLLAMVDDVSVVLIKLAERLCILRNIAIFNDARKKQAAKETMDIYAPLANRLGIGQLKWQLEDLSFRYLQPEDYKKLSTALNERRIDRENYIRSVTAELENLMKSAGIQNVKISGRAKHIYSIYRKMTRKKVDIEEIYDVSAFRVLAATVEDCYIALSAVHSRWPHIKKEFDDYINSPKANGYRSIHTAVVGPDNKHIEIQIRTQQMHDEAELGIAAHWIYKEGNVRKPSSYEEKIAWLRQVMDWQKEVAKTEAAKADIQTELFDDRIYVFTPNSAVLDLPKGATPLDFAYQVHSELGHRCRGAKVNGHIVPLTYHLNTGERVEILTVKEGHPSRDWLNPHLGYVTTTRAKAKILQWFRKLDYDKNLVDGRAQVEKEQRRLGIKTLELEAIANKLNYKNSNDLLAALGHGDVGLATLMNLAAPAAGPVTPDEITAKIEQGKAKLSESLTDIDIHGVGNLLTHIALCCKPVPGDSIIGYVTIGRGISIHRRDCINVTTKAQHDERIVQVSWGSKIQRNYAIDLIIAAHEDPNLIRNLTALLATENIPILSMINNSKKDSGTLHIIMTVEMSSAMPLSKIIASIHQLPNVYEVKRVG